MAPVLAVAILAMWLVYTPRPRAEQMEPPRGWEFPPEIVLEATPLEPDHLEMLTRDGAETAERWRFTWRGISGSMMLITSTTWRAHHQPERCYDVYGLSVDDSHPHLVTPDFPLRFVSLGDGERMLSATYWLQSKDQTTDDYGTRIWADLAPERKRWVLVTVLFDEAYDPGTPGVRAFCIALHDAVARNL